jgi:hypothetical protein
MNRSIVAGLLFIGFAASATAAQSGPLIGLRARALPERYHAVDGAAVLAPPRAISWDVIDVSSVTWLTLSVAVAAPDSAMGTELSGAPIVDAVQVAVSRGTMLLFADCGVNDQPDPRIAAVVRPTGSGHPEVLRAWRPDLLAKRIVELPAASVACELIPED